MNGVLEGVRLIVRDKNAFRMEEGVLRQIGKPMDIVRALGPKIGIVHIVDLNARDGNATNFDLYDHITYKRNVEVEVSGNSELVGKLLGMKARAVLELPCRLDLGKFADHKRLLVGKTDGRHVDERVFDYYIESDDAKAVKKLVGEGKRVFLYSAKIGYGQAEKLGVFALIRDC